MDFLEWNTHMIWLIKRKGARKSIAWQNRGMNNLVHVAGIFFLCPLLLKEIQQTR